MPFAVTHILFPIVLADIFRHHLLKTRNIKKWQFSTKWIYFVGFMGVLPDIDILLQWGTYALFGRALIFHGGFTHQLYIPLFAFLLALFFFLTKKMPFFLRNARGGHSRRTLTLFFLLIGIGFLTHISLDCAVEGGYPLIPPFIGNGFCTRLVPAAYQTDFLAGLDAVLFITWLLYEEKRHKIRDFL